MSLMYLAQEGVSAAEWIFARATSLLEYGIAGILIFVLIAWFIERRETIRRFERLLKESAVADMEVAKALYAVQTLLTLHGWSTSDGPSSTDANADKAG